MLQRPAFQQFYNLEFEEAQKDYEAQIARHPDVAQGYNLLAQAVIFRTMYRAGALESSLVADTNPFFTRPKAEMSAADEKLFLESLDKALSLSRAALEKNPNDVSALYAMGVAFGFRADYDFVVKKAWITALRDFTQARKFHNRVSELDPMNADARLTQGLHTYIAGNLTFPWKQLGFLAGFHGDKETGIRILREVAEHGESNKADALVFLAAIYRRDHHPELGIPLMETLIRWFPRNYIFRVDLVRLYLDLKQKDKAAELVLQLEQWKQSGAPGAEKLPASQLAELRQAVR